MLELADYRRQVSDLYQGLRDRGIGEESWQWWREQRDHLLLTHPQSSLVGTDGAVANPPQFYPYDPTWQVTARVETWDDIDSPPSLVAGDGAEFTQIGTARFDRLGVEHSLGLYWLNAYAGGLFVPFKDQSNGDTTYGAGRYLLDTVKVSRFRTRSKTSRRRCSVPRLQLRLSPVVCLGCAVAVSARTTQQRSGRRGCRWRTQTRPSSVRPPRE